MAFRCGGRARRATRSACRRANSRRVIRSAYGQSVSLRRARPAGDLFRVSARQQPLVSGIWSRRVVAAGTRGRRPVARVGARRAAHRAYDSWHRTAACRRPPIDPDDGSPPTRVTGHPHSARAYPRVPPNTPCSRPRWRGRELGASYDRKLRRSRGCLHARCLSLGLRAHSTASWRTSAVCWCCAVPPLVALQTAASGAANGRRWVGTHTNSRFAPERGRTIRFGTRAWVRHGTIRVNGTTPGSVFRAGFRNAHAPPDHAYQVSAYRFRMPRSAQKGTCAP
jgi:hypothetical protein